MRIIKEEDPDLIIIPGDLFDTGRNLEISFELLEELKGRTVLFTSGNHDRYLEEFDELCARMKDMGVHVLENECFVFREDVTVGGLSDSGRTPALWTEEADNIIEDPVIEIEFE